MQQKATQTSERVEQVIYAHLLAHNGLLAINKLFDSFHAVIITLRIFELCFLFRLWGEEPNVNVLLNVFKMT